MKAGKFDCIKVIDDLKCATLVQALVGSDKEKLMIMSVSQFVCSICKEFGKYIRFVVDIDNSEQPGGVQQSLLQSLTTSTARNAFSIMITAQKQIQLGDNGVPFTIQVKTNEDRLYNDRIRLMKEIGVKWNDPDFYAAKKALWVLWYVDGHHETIAERAPKVPSLFSRYVGYNFPEKHKHHKRALENLWASEVRAHAMMLQDMLQASWF